MTAGRAIRRGTKWLVRLVGGPVLLLRQMLMALAMLFAALAAPAAATDIQRGVTDPRGFVARTYATYRANPDTPPADLSFVYSDRLRALYDDYDAWQASHQDLVGSVAFDWWTNSQDWGDVRIDDLAVTFDGPDRLTITVRFINFDRTDTNRFQFVRVGERWYLDEVVNGSGSGDNGWTLSALLRERQE